MSKQTINIGASPNDGTGTPLRTSFDYTNQNFTEIYTALGGGVALPGATTQVIFNDGGTNLAGDAGLVYNKTTDALTVAGLVTAGSAAITGAATVGTTLGVTGVSTFAAGTALLPALTTTGDTNTGIYYPAADTFAVTTGGTERVRVNSSGIVGVAITPSAWDTANYNALQVSRTAVASLSNIGIFAANWFADTGGDKYIATATAARIDVNNSGQIQFKIAPSGTAGNAITFTQAMTLDATGNLLVGTTTLGARNTNIFSKSAGFALEVQQRVAVSGGSGLGITYSVATPNNGTDYFQYCADATAVRLYITSNGGIANYQANNANLSDARTKTDIKPLASYWDKIKALQLVTFKYKDQTHSDDNIGLIAQQVEAVAPELIDVDGFGETPADGVPLKTIYTTDLYHAAIKALQEAMTRIEVLEAKLA